LRSGFPGSVYTCSQSRSHYLIRALFVLQTCGAQNDAAIVRAAYRAAGLGIV
jgi:hypothetical protein